MNKITHHILTWLAALALLPALHACTDDPIFNVEGAEGGMAYVSLEARFLPHDDAVLGSRAAGDAIDAISDLFVAFYSTSSSRELLHHFYYTPAHPDVSISNTATGGADRDVIYTAKVTNVVVPMGSYYAVAVANMGDLAATHPDEVDTLDGLRNIRLQWDNTAPTSNNQMSGYFTAEKLAEPATDATVKAVTIAGSTPTIHAWMRRAASKVTVSFDNSRLAEDTYIYIQSIQIKDIPRECNLMAKNSPTAADASKRPELLYEDGEKWTVGQGNDYTAWPYITSFTNGFLKLFDNPADAHSRTNPHSFFFYENMQGQGKSKHQIDPDLSNAPANAPTYPDGVDPSSPYWKDAKPFGSYIEVKGYYDSFNEGNHSRGPITYRFMLGKDVDKDYDAERNHHYKLTLCFVGNANDVDWHIDYEEEPFIYVPSPYYISYQYDKQMMLPVSFRGDVKRVTAEIIYNGWNAEAETGDIWSDNHQETVTVPGLSGSSTGWTTFYGGATWNNSNPRNPQSRTDKATGFLSLRWDESRSIETPGNEFNQNPTAASNGINHLVNYWNDNNLGYREYWNPMADAEAQANYAATSVDSSPGALAGKYEVVEEVVNNNRHLVFMLPMYTRPLNLVTSTGHSGNNPFFNYVRKAVVRITGYTSSGDKVAVTGPDGVERNYTDVDIIQVRRIINPKAIYRHNDNDEDFKVTLMHRIGDQSGSGAETMYESFNSRGPWRATIKLGKEWVRIGKGANPSGTDDVVGKTDEPVEFYYKPAGKNTGAPPRFGIIEVTYHNNTCSHTILVRQGYNPVALLPGGARWSSFNMRSKTEMCASPLEEGSLFRAGKLDSPIDPSNLWSMNLRDYKTSFKMFGSSSTKTWTAIGSDLLSASAGKETGFQNWYPTIGNVQYQVAELQDFYYLRNDPVTNDVTADIDISYGIVYADGARECQADPAVAHGYTYQRGNSGPYVTSIYGMRGCIVYNNKTGANVFFPGGATGYGRLVNESIGGTNNAGRMRYGGTNTPISTASGNAWIGNRPLLHRLDRNFGMQYWHRKYESTGLKQNGAVIYSSAWDFNISTYDFNMLQGVGNKDAGYVRMIVKGGRDEGYKGVKDPLFPNYKN